MKLAKTEGEGEVAHEGRSPHPLSWTPYGWFEEGKDGNGGSGASFDDPRRTPAPLLLEAFQWKAPQGRSEPLIQRVHFSNASGVQ